MNMNLKTFANYSQITLFFVWIIFESKTIFANRHYIESENYRTITFNNFHLKILNIYYFQEELLKFYCKYKIFAYS